MIEGAWAYLKRLVNPRHRDEASCPKKLLEFLWKRQNSNDLHDGLLRRLRNNTRAS
ncbi:hypothetical protein BDB01DRAFT_800254 [Pilobolus umbonatus]|nr:hypothetical protein BDB01DRAFT_800254 [Pilobolus umbonatus]